MIELNKIYNQDCLDGLKLIEDNSIDCIIIDPPYGINYSQKFEYYTSSIGESFVLTPTQGIQLDNDRSTYYNPLPTIKDKIVPELIGKHATLTVIDNSKNNAFSDIDISQGSGTSFSDKDKYIIRQTAINAAAKYYSKRTGSISLILSMAMEIENWIIREK